MSVPLNVGFGLLTLFPGRVGGSETYVRGLLERFAEHEGPERFTVLANRHVADAYAELARGPVALHEVSSYRPGNRPPTRALAMAKARIAPGRAARDVPGDLDLLHLPVTVPIPEIELPRVVTLHDVAHLDLPRVFSRAQRRYRRWAYDGSARRANLVVTVSEFSRQRIVERLGVAPERIAAIPHGIDHATFAPASDESGPVVSGLPERYLLYPANLWPHKNHLRLLDALAAVNDPDLHLVLTGQIYGRLRTVVAHARRRGLRSRLHHLGHIPRERLAALYRRATAMVFPSLYEGFGQPPLEAMACGCPVAASDRGAVAEVCGEAALGFDPDDVDSIAGAVGRVAGDEALRARLREAGMARAAEFSWERSAAAHLEVYRRVADGYPALP